MSCIHLSFAPSILICLSNPPWSSFAPIKSFRQVIDKCYYIAQKRIVQKWELHSSTSCEPVQAKVRLLREGLSTTRKSYQNWKQRFYQKESLAKSATHFASLPFQHLPVPAWKFASSERRTSCLVSHMHPQTQSL